MVPPGGIDDGRHYVNENEIVCPKCYKKFSEAEHTGNTIEVTEPVGRSPSTAKMKAAPRATRPPSGLNRALGARNKKSSKTGRSANRRSSGRLPTLGRRGGGANSSLQGKNNTGTVVLVGVLLAVSVIGAVILYSGGHKPAKSRRNGNTSGAGVYFTVKPLEKGGGRVRLNPPGGRYMHSTALTMVAEADPGYEFAGWETGPDPMNPSRTVMVVRSLRPVANFREKKQPAETPAPMPIPVMPAPANTTPKPEPAPAPKPDTNPAPEEAPGPQ